MNASRAVLLFVSSSAILVIERGVVSCSVEGGTRYLSPSHSADACCCSAALGEVFPYALASWGLTRVRESGAVGSLGEVKHSSRLRLEAAVRCHGFPR